MTNTRSRSTDFLYFLINSTAGDFKQYRITFWSQLILGFLYSFNYFDSEIAGFVLGFLLPAMWIILLYRFALIKAKVNNSQLPFPKWMQKDPGNFLVIFMDIILLAAVWTMILSGYYNPVWLKVLFTMVFPILTISMLRNLILFSFIDNVDEKENILDENNNN
jgi:hypothetical protein